MLPFQTGFGSDGNEGVLRIPQSVSISRTSPSDFLVLYWGHLLGESYPSAEMCCILICRCMQNHNDDTIKTSGHSSSEKYTSHFNWKGSKGLRRVLLCERCVGDWTEPQHIDPHSSGHYSVSFPFSWAAQPGAWGPSLCWDMVLIPASYLQLTWTSCRWGYIVIWRPSTSCERHNSRSVQPLDSQGHPLIS